MMKEINRSKFVGNRICRLHQLVIRGIREGEIPSTGTFDDFWEGCRNYPDIPLGMSRKAYVEQYLTFLKDTDMAKINGDRYEIKVEALEEDIAEIYRRAGYIVYGNNERGFVISNRKTKGYL